MLICLLFFHKFLINDWLEIYHREYECLLALQACHACGIASKRVIFVAPGIGAIHGFCAAATPNAICAGIAPCSPQSLLSSTMI
jgi:hypothetical protein